MIALGPILVALHQPRLLSPNSPPLDAGPGVDRVYNALPPYDGSGVYYSPSPPCRTPCVDRVYNALPPESRVASVQMMVPEHAPPNPSCVLFLAATGDQGYSRRLNLGAGLLKEVSGRRS